MKKITSIDALNLLMQDIKTKEDLTKPENKWILHSIYVGLAARRIAAKLNLNEDFALSAGYLHDIGRRIDHNNHPIEGYFYLKNLEYDNIARYSLTHSFLNNDITKTVGTGPSDPDSYKFINDYLNSINKDLFDNILHLCDLMCLDTGFTTIEKRILDVITRKGISENSYSHYMDLMDFKRWLEIEIRSDLYDLFPEIKKEDLDSRLLDKQLLLSFIKPKYLTKKNNS